MITKYETDSFDTVEYVAVITDDTVYQFTSLPELGRAPCITVDCEVLEFIAAFYISSFSDQNVF